MENIYYSQRNDSYVSSGIHPIGIISFTIDYSSIPAGMGMVVLKDAVAVILMEHFDDFMTFCVWNPDEFENQFGFRPGIECGLGPVLEDGSREHFPVLAVL